MLDITIFAQSSPLLWGIAAALFVLLAVEVYQERGGRARALLARQKPAVQGLVTLLWLAALLLLGALGGYTGAGFIYAQY